MALNCADFYDAELSRYNAHLRAAAGVAQNDHVLDIGCGAGQTTREVAQLALNGSVVGIDTSAAMLEIARQRSADEGLRNVGFAQGDAQTYAFPPASFDLCISRFGVMFFAGPAAAFTNISRAMRPGARLVWMVWQRQDRNPWSAAIRTALTPDAAAPAEALPAFSLGDAVFTRDLLRGAGFAAITFSDVHEQVFYGATVDEAYDALIGLQFADARAVTADTELRLRAMLRMHLTPQGVFFNSRAWIIRAHVASGDAL